MKEIFPFSKILKSYSSYSYHHEMVSLDIKFIFKVVLFFFNENFKFFPNGTLRRPYILVYSADVSKNRTTDLIYNKVNKK